MTAAQTTLLHAAELLEADARYLQECYNFDSDKPDWDTKIAAREMRDDALCTALELRLLARSIHAGHAAVPPAPTFEKKGYGNENAA